MPYSHTTFGTLKTQLANRLGDSGKVYWPDDQLGRLLSESLRMWQSLTGYARDSGVFSTVSGTAFYDIRNLTNSSGAAILSYTVTDSDVIKDIQYHLLEPVTGTSWTGSEQFTFADITGALTRRRDAFLLETGAVITRTTQILGAGSRFFDVPDTTLQIRRLAWIDSSGVAHPLHPEDISSQRSYGAGFLLTPDTPFSYSSSSTQPLRYLIAPPTNEPGTLDMLLIQSGATLSGTGAALGIPDDFAWVIKWGVLADILGREGPGQDLPRAYYCERRWQLGLEVAKAAATVINAEINGIATSPDTISQLDVYSPQWQSTLGTPEFISSLRNMIGLANCPNDVYGVLLDVVCKTPLPTSDRDYVQIGREFVDAILDYAEHLAAFQCGGYEFRHTYRAATNFFKAALSYNQKLAAQSPAIEDLIKQSTDDDRVLRRERPTNNNVLESLTANEQ